MHESVRMMANDYLSKESGNQGIYRRSAAKQLMVINGYITWKFAFPFFLHKLPRIMHEFIHELFSTTKLHESFTKFFYPEL